MCLVIMPSYVPERSCANEVIEAIVLKKRVVFENFLLAITK